MEYRILGRTGLRVSAVALGCEGFIHKTPEEVCADFDFAIGHGVNFIDIYSPNPELRTNIGAALEGRRGDFVIQGHLCTTWENGQYLRTRDPEKTLASFDLQLQQLRTDCLDIGMSTTSTPKADFHRVFGGEIIRIAQRLREEGRIRHIGHQQPQSRGGPDGRRNGTGGRADVLGKPLLRPATGRATTSRPCGPRRVTPARCATSTPTANGSTNCAKGRAWASTP